MVSIKLQSKAGLPATTSRVGRCLSTGVTPRPFQGRLRRRPIGSPDPLADNDPWLAPAIDWGVHACLSHRLWDSVSASPKR